MSEQIKLKDRLKSPFERDYVTGHIYDAQGKLAGLIVNSDRGRIHDFADFTVAALNEKWERDFSEPMRWMKEYALGFPHLRCSKCDYIQSLMANMIKDFSYCPSCGQRLLPPETSKPLCPICPEKEDCPHADNRTQCWEYEKAVENKEAEL